MESPGDRRDLERAMLARNRLPPGQSLTLKFPVLDLGQQPRIEPADWELRITGAVEEEVRIGWDELCALPRSKVVMDLHCVTRWSKFDTEWEGVSVADLFREKGVRPRPAATHVLQHAADGYTTNLPLAVVAQENYLIATLYSGEPIAIEHGGPVRAVIGQIPDRTDLFTPYLWKGAKWLVGLELLTADRPGFWEKNGYSNEADVWSEQRFG